MKLGLIGDLEGELGAAVDCLRLLGERGDVSVACQLGDLRFGYGPDQLTYGDMLQGVALAMNGRKLPILVVPMLTPGLSSRWLALITDVDVTTGRNLIDSMSTEVVVRDTSIRDVVPGDPLSYDESVRRALAERAASEEQR